MKFSHKHDFKFESVRDVSLVPNSDSFFVFDVPGNPITYDYSYLKGLKFISAVTEEVPVPDVFLGTLHSLVLSYASVPYGQYADAKETSFYAKALQQMANLAKFDSIQMTSISTKIR